MDARVDDSATTTGQCRVKVISADEVDRTVPRDAWEDLARGCKNPYVLYQSSAWWDHLRSTDQDEGLFMAVATDTVDHRIIGLVPVLCKNHVLKLHVGTRAVFRAPVPSVVLLGSYPMMPERNDLYDAIVRTLWEAFPDCRCIYAKSIPVASRFGEYLGSSGELRSHSIAYSPEGFRSLHLIDLPKNFQEYLVQFRSKERRDFARRVRRLREFSEAGLRLVRIETAEQVDQFVGDAAFVARRSWQYRDNSVKFEDDPANRSRLADLGRRGVLRSYLLTSGDRHYAFLVGYQYLDVYYASITGYDQALRHFSPGKLLFYLVVQDLIEHDSPRRLNFDTTDLKYKRDFANVHVTDAGYLLLRPGWRNRSLLIRHATTRAALEALKTLFRRTHSTIGGTHRRGVAAEIGRKTAPTASCAAP